MQTVLMIHRTCIAILIIMGAALLISLILRIYMISKINKVYKSDMARIHRIRELKSTFNSICDRLFKIINITTIVAVINCIVYIFLK